MLSISVVIVTRNRREKLSRLLESLKEGTTLPDQIIIIDNMSTDGTEEMINEYIRTKENFKKIIRLEKEKKIGISFARNTGLNLSTTDIVAFTDDDCVVDPNWVSKILELHQQNPKITAIGGKTNNFPSNDIGLCGHILRRYRTHSDILDQKNTDKEQPQLMRSLSTQNISYKKKLIKGLEFGEGLDPSEAMDFSWKILKVKGTILYHPEMIVFHEYRRSIISFFKQSLWYAKSAAIMNKQAKRNGYSPTLKKREKLTTFIRICFTEILKEEISFAKKIKLILILVPYQIIFSATYYLTKFTK